VPLLSRSRHLLRNIEIHDRVSTLTDPMHDSSMTRERHEPMDLSPGSGDTPFLCPPRSNCSRFRPGSAPLNLVVHDLLCAWTSRCNKADNARMKYRDVQHECRGARTSSRARLSRSRSPRLRLILDTLLSPNISSSSIKMTC
jgi:hypothetical protein